MKNNLVRWPREDRQLRKLRQTPKDMPSADAFWSNFRERASRVSQDVPDVRVASPWLAPAFAAALVLLLAGGVGFWMQSDSAVPSTLQVEVLEMGDDVYSYMIWDDAAGQGTLLWLMEADGTAEGGS